MQNMQSRSALRLSHRQVSVFLAQSRLFRCSPALFLCLAILPWHSLLHRPAFALPATTLKHPSAQTSICSPHPSHIYSTSAPHPLYIHPTSASTSHTYSTSTPHPLLCRLPSLRVCHSSAHSTRQHSFNHSRLPRLPRRHLALGLHTDILHSDILHSPTHSKVKNVVNVFINRKCLCHN
ncbi:hypothetical protein GQ42DRAFT_91259 [Ramicandelaber brevisporus]|nr:hypothetical protein GQ42DRAFT_91259 [Ramicandelaber brevisporus]